jgi:hypothetical protein
MEQSILLSKFFPAIFFLVFCERGIYLSKTNFGGKKIYLAKEYFDLAKKVIRFQNEWFGGKSAGCWQGEHLNV